MSQKKLFLALFISLTSIGFSAQTLKGKVFGTNNVPLSEASVYIKKLYKGVSTNNKGEFKIHIKKKILKTDTLVFSHIGYTAKRLSFHDFVQSNRMVTLEPKLMALDEVTVSTKRKRLKTFLNYTKLPPLERGLFSFGSVLANNKIYVSGGNKSNKFNPLNNAFDLDKYTSRPFTPISQILQETGTADTWDHYNDELYAYDLETETWEKSSLKFIKRAHHNLHFYDGKIMVIGGKTLSKNRKFQYLENKIEEFNVGKNKIAIDEANPHKAVNFASFLKDDYLIVLGGSKKITFTGIKKFENKIHVYDLKKGYWYHVSYMPVPKETTGVLIDDTIYLFGGNNGQSLKNIESFNIKNGRWKIEGELFSAEDRPAITHHENTVYIYVKGRVLTFNVDTKELNQYLINLAVESPTLYCANDKLYILGGFTNRYSRTTVSNDLFSIDINEFDKTALNKSRTF